ncbi:MAG: leucine-rich repeat protein [Firmicutes bacterium]|nr:leucine-rich repeat protein [Bacillota bacterium]
MIRSTQKRHLLALLTVVLALFALLLMHPTAGAVDADEDELIGANIQDGVLLGYYGPGGDIVIPNTVTKIGDEAFKGNKKVTSVTIPGSVVDIGNNAFEACENLKKVAFTNPDEARNNLLIRLSAFKDCTKLTDVEIPARVKQIVGNIFKGCTSLMEIKVNANNPYYFAQDGVLFGPALVEYAPQYDDNYVLLAYPAGRQGEYTIPSQVNEKTIDQVWTSGFEGAAGLTDITIPASIGRLGTAAFESTGLTHVTIPDTVQQVDPAVFQNCTSLVSVKLPEGITEIDQYLFANCISLQHVDMPDTITKINIYAFHNCTSLTSLALPKGLTSLSVGCFEKCYNLQHVVVPPSVINFPKDDDVGVYNPFKYSPVTVYVQKGSTGDRFFNNNLAELQASATASGGSLKVVTLDSVADPASIDVSSLELIDAGRQISVAGKFRIGSYLNVQPLTSGRDYNAFSAKANGKAFQAYDLSLLPSGTTASGPFTLTIGQPDSYSSSAKLYDANGAIATDYSSDCFTATLSALGPVALIDVNEATGDTAVTSVTLNRSALSLEVGKTGKLSATVWPTSAADKSITWSSSKTDVASVSSNGTVTAKKAGTAVITATATNGKSASCTVTVTGGTTDPDPGQPEAAVSADVALRNAGLANSDPSFRLALKNAKNVTTVSVHFTVDASTVTVTGLNGFQVLDQPKGSVANGKYTGEVMLAYLSDGRTAFTQTGETGIASFVTNGDTPTLKITGVTLSGWDSDGKAIFGTTGSIDPNEVKFVATTYDLNGDGKVDQLDITVAQAAYQARSTESDWNTPGTNGVAPSACDVTGDGVVDIQDLIAIYLNFTA